MTAPFTFNTAPSIVFGEGKATEIGALAAGRGWTRVLLVTDPGLVTVGLVDPCVASLAASISRASIRFIRSPGCSFPPVRSVT